MPKQLILPNPQADCINELFGYEIEVFQKGQWLTPGHWVAIIFEWSEPPPHQFQSGGPAKLRKLFLDGMDVLVERLKGTDIVGVFAETEIHENLLHRIGFEIIDGRNEVDNYEFGRCGYMSLSRFFEKPWLASR